jgi:hypothetical protein
MMTDDLAQARERKLQRQGLLSPLVGEIAEALVELDGAADRDRVADHVARRRGAREASEALRRELGQALEQHCRQVALEDLTPAFAWETRTWSLTPNALAFFSKHMRRRAGG